LIFNKVAILMSRTIHFFPMKVINLLSSFMTYNYRVVCKSNMTGVFNGAGA